MANNAFLVHTGKSLTTSRLRGLSVEPNWLGWGGGANQGTGVITSPTDTTLFSEHAEARVQGTSSQVTTAVTNDTYQVVGTLIASAAKTVNEVGLFAGSDKAAAVMYAKGDHADFVLAIDEGIQYTIQVQYKHQGQA